MSVTTVVPGRMGGGEYHDENHQTVTFSGDTRRTCSIAMPPPTPPGVGYVRGCVNRARLSEVPRLLNVGDAWSMVKRPRQATLKCASPSLPPSLPTLRVTLAPASLKPHVDDLE